VRFRRIVAVAAVVVAARVVCGGDGDDRARRPPPRLATFNIENYPASDRQEAGALAAIRATGAQVVAVQEIMDPPRFRRALRAALGGAWSTAFVALEDRSLHAVGLAFDRRAVRLAWARTSRATVTYPGARPTLEARLYPRGGGGAMRVFVIHLKAGGDGHAARARQLDALAPELARARAEGDDVYVLGDFNATGPADRALVQRIAGDAGLTWASRELACTAYWDRDDGCLGAALDHVLAPRPPRAIFAAEPCRSNGCALRDRCPAFVHEISDHCPVVVELP